MGAFWEKLPGLTQLPHPSPGMRVRKRVGLMLVGTFDNNVAGLTNLMPFAWPTTLLSLAQPTKCIPRGEPVVR